MNNADRKSVAAPMANRSAARRRILRDIMVTAFEGGSNYWAEARNVKREPEGLKARDGREALDYISFELRSAEDADDERLGQWVRIDEDAVARGIRLIAESRDKDAPTVGQLHAKTAHPMSRTHPSYGMAACGVGSDIYTQCCALHGGAVEVDYDACTADCIIQAAMWGEIVYG